MATAAAEAVAIPVDEDLKRAAKKVEADLSKIATKIHRYPAIFRSLISKDDCYFVPRVVAIGPYHHGALHLQEAEEVKRAAAYYFCRDSGHSVDEVYQKILSVAANARSCYADDAVASIGEGDFAAMMFHDGCFLLQYILNRFDIVDVALQSWFYSNDASMVRDIFLLENQLPWQVLDILRSFRSIHVGRFICQCASSFDAYVEFDKSPFVLDEIEYKPPHLLGLLWFYQSRLLNKPTESRTIDLPERDMIITSLPQCKSAIELAEMGIKLVANKKSHFRNMGISQGLLSGKLFLAPLVMDELNAYWLLNMVALEICLQGTSLGDQLFVSSYVYLLAILMNREEDVHELRVRGILHGKSSNRHTLIFFKNLAQLISIPIQYSFLNAQLEAYKRKRWMWIPIHKFAYNNFKTIITVFPIIGVLVGILRTLLSIKQHQQ